MISTHILGSEEDIKWRTALGSGASGDHLGQAETILVHGEKYVHIAHVHKHGGSCSSSSVEV